MSRVSLVSGKPLVTRGPLQWVQKRGPREELRRKQIFLPNFTITFLRTPKSPPTFARFLVPLNLNKLDLQDYLYNAYGVAVKNVRSYIQQQKVQQDKPGAKRPRPRYWFRPRAIKYMMVELKQPFVWPEAPEDLEPWDKSTHDQAKEDNKKNEQRFAHDRAQKPTPERESIAEQAKKILEKKEWEGGIFDQVWEDVGDPVEVEQDIQIPALEEERKS